MALEAGTSLGPYRILAPIGAGGLGEVYRALDTRLDRTVAVKVLPSEIASDPDRRLRLEREARAVAALNHPHVCTLYDVGHQDAVSFLVMEYVDGEPLAARLRRGPLPLPDAVRYAIQVGQALDHAHKHGIVHRDLKPANVLLTAGGVKVIDFGLARLSTQTQVTQVGTVLGTPGYMSPEQLRGEPADHRADIWALGVLLYEMVTGVAPFAAEQPEAVWRMILQGQPVPLNERVADAPEALVQAIDKALAKRADDRFDSMSWLLSDLNRVLPASDKRTVGPRVSRVGVVRPARRAWAILALALGLALVVGGRWIVLNRPAARPLLTLTSPVQMSADIGVEDFPTWSPDGRMLAYESNSGGDWDIWLTQLSGSTPVNRTSDDPAADRFPSWSPNGASIAFWSAREGGGVFVMPALSGRPRKLPFSSTVGIVRPVWSADSSRLATMLPKEGANAIEILTIASGEHQRIPVNAEVYELAWAPDGRFFACIHAQSATSDVSRLILVRVSDARTFEVVERYSSTWSPLWSPDSRTLYFVSNRSGSMDLWQQRVNQDGPEGAAMLLTNGIGIRHATLSADGRRLAYAKGRRIANIWRAPIRTDRPAAWSDAEQLTWDEAAINFLDVSPDGERVVFSSDRAGNQDLWVLRLAAKELDRLTTTPIPEWAPRWSPDGTTLTFGAYEDGNRELFTVAIGGGPVTRITRNTADDLWPVWSPDGRHIAFYSDRAGNMDVWTTDAQGDNAKQLTSNSGYEGRPAWSPDGEWIAYRLGGNVGSSLAIVPAAGGSPKRIIGGRVGVCRWLADGVQISCVGSFSAQGASATTDTAVPMELWEIDVRRGTARRLSALSGKRGEMGAWGLSVHGQHLYFTWEEDKGDIWVMDATGTLQ